MPNPRSRKERTTVGPIRISLKYVEKRVPQGIVFSGHWVATASKDGKKAEGRTRHYPSEAIRQAILGLDPELAKEWP